MPNGSPKKNAVSTLAIETHFVHLGRDPPIVPQYLSAKYFVKGLNGMLLRGPSG